MKKLISAVLAALLLFLAAAPVLADNMDDLFEHMYVNCADGKKLNLREEPNGKIIARLDNGTKVWISGGYIQRGWVAVTVKQKDGTTLSGVVKSEFLQTKKPGKYEITEREDNFKDAREPYIVTAKALNKKTDKSVGLRPKPNKTAKAVCRLTAGDELLVLAEGKTWLKVQVYMAVDDDLKKEKDKKQGKIGYVAKDYTEFSRYLEIEGEE